MSATFPSVSFASNVIRHRPCSKCRAPMSLLHTKPSRIGFDLRTFECSNCNNLETSATESTAYRWTQSDLKPPE